MEFPLGENFHRNDLNYQFIRISLMSFSMYKNAALKCTFTVRKVKKYGK